MRENRKDFSHENVQDPAAFLRGRPGPGESRRGPIKEGRKFPGSVRASGKFARFQQTRIVVLAQRLIDGDRNRVGEVQTAGLADHGNADALRIIPPQQALRKSAVFAPENQIRAVRVGGFAVYARRLGGEIKEGAVRIAVKKILQIAIVGDVQQIPVVQSGSFTTSSLLFNLAIFTPKTIN